MLKERWPSLNPAGLRVSRHRDGQLVSARPNPGLASERYTRRPFRLLATKQTVLSPRLMFTVPAIDHSVTAEAAVRQPFAGWPVAQEPRLELAPRDGLQHNSAVAAAQHRTKVAGPHDFGRLDAG